MFAGGTGARVLPAGQGCRPQGGGSPHLVSASSAASAAATSAVGRACTYIHSHPQDAQSAALHSPIRRASAANRKPSRHPFCTASRAARCASTGTWRSTPGCATGSPQCPCWSGHGPAPAARSCSAKPGGNNCHAQTCSILLENALDSKTQSSRMQNEHVQVFAVLRLSICLGVQWNALLLSRGKSLHCLL